MELFQSETGEKTQATHVDREDGNPAGSGKARGGEHRAVTPEHEEKLRCVCHALTRQTLRTIRQTLSCLFVNESLNATRAEPFQQWRNNDDEIRAARARNDAYGLERLSGVHVRKGFYSRAFLRAWRKYS